MATRASVPRIHDAIGGGPTPLTRYSSTSSHRVRELRRPAIAARLPGVERAVVVVEPERARADRAWRSRAARRAGTSGASRAHRLQLGEQVQVVDAGQAVGADRHRHARRDRTARSAARRRPPTGCCAGTSRASRPRSASRARLGVVELHAVHDQRPRVEDAQVDRGTRPGRSRAPPSRRARRRSARSSARHGPRAGREKLDSPRRDSPRCTLVIGRRWPSTASRIARNSAGDTEYGACGASVTRTLAGCAPRRPRARPAPTSAPVASR